LKLIHVLLHCPVIHNFSFDYRTLVPQSWSFVRWWKQYVYSLYDTGVCPNTLFRLY